MSDDPKAGERRGEVLLRLLKTPPKPHSEMKVGKRPKTKVASKRGASAKVGEPSA